MKTDSIRGLRLRLVLLVFLAVIPALLLILYTARVQRLVEKENTQNNLSQIVRLTVSETTSAIEGARQLLGGLAQFEEIHSGDSAVCGAAMAKLLRTYTQYSMLGVAAPDGRVVCSAVPMAGSASVADQDWFREAMQTRDFTVGKYQVDRTTGKASVYFAYPLEEGGQIQKVVFGALDLLYLYQRISLARLPNATSVVVVDRQQTVLAAFPEAGLQGRPAPESGLLKEVASYRGQGMGEIAGPDGVWRIYAYSPISGKRETVPAYVSVSMPMDSVMADANQSLTSNLLGLAIVSVLALVAAWFGGHTFVLGKVNEELEQRVQERTKELAHEQMLLKMLMDNIPDTIYFKDSQSRFTRINQAQAKVLGVQSPEQAVGKSDSDFFTHEHAQAALADERRILESGQGLISKTERIRRNDGQFRWVTATKVPLRDNSGSVVGLVGISRDVTERVKAEHLMGNLVESLPDLVYVKDTQGHYVLDNANHRASLGFRTLEEIAGKTVFDLYPKELAEKIRADDEAVLKGKVPVLNRQENFTNYRGEKIPVSTSKYPYRDEQGNFAGLICVSRILGGATKA